MIMRRMPSGILRCHLQIVRILYRFFTGEFHKTGVTSKRIRNDFVYLFFFHFITSCDIVPEMRHYTIAFFVFKW